VGRRDVAFRDARSDAPSPSRARRRAPHEKSDGSASPELVAELDRREAPRQRSRTRPAFAHAKSTATSRASSRSASRRGRRGREPGCRKPAANASEVRRARRRSRGPAVVVDRDPLGRRTRRDRESSRRSYACRRSRFEKLFTIEASRSPFQTSRWPRSGRLERASGSARRAAPGVSGITTLSPPPWSTSGRRLDLPDPVLRVERRACVACAATPRESGDARAVRIDLFDRAPALAHCMHRAVSDHQSQAASRSSRREATERLEPDAASGASAARPARWSRARAATPLRIRQRELLCDVATEAHAEGRSPAPCCGIEHGPRRRRHLRHRVRPFGTSLSPTPDCRHDDAKVLREQIGQRPPAEAVIPEPWMKKERLGPSPRTRTRAGRRSGGVTARSHPSCAVRTLSSEPPQAAGPAARREARQPPGRKTNDRMERRASRKRGCSSGVRSTLGRP